MARWDEILALPVQNPQTSEFSASELVWSKVEGWRDSIDRVALIPFARVDDFVRGESANKDCPSRFHVESRRKRSTKTPYKPKVDGILEYILYWCSFGPDDHRKGGIVRPSRTTYVPKKSAAGRPNTKRGCCCHFIVKRLIAEPSVALIIYNEDRHVDKKGLPCHGPQDEKSAGTRAMYAPYISEDLRLRVISLLHVGVSVETIMQRHTEYVEKQGGPSNRDDLLTHRYVRRQERSIRRSSYELDVDDAVSIGMWVENHQSQVFFYEDFSESGPFTLGIQTEWQLHQMVQFGNHNLLVSDSKFGTNKLKYNIHSLLVFNSDNKAIPVAWIISPRFSNCDPHRWMRALFNRVCTKDSTWKLAGFIIDDPTADILTIRDVFQCSVLVSFWRIRHAWQKNLVKKCLDAETRVQILRRLGKVVRSICRGDGSMSLFEDIMEDFVDVSDFMEYFKAVWYHRIENWSMALKSLPLASQETCAALEFYHNQLKLRLFNEKDPNVYHRADWLVDKLGTKVHSYFWLDEYTGKDDFARYWKDEWVSGLTSWRKSLKIPDCNVVIEGEYAKVVDPCDENLVHVVLNPGSEFAVCNCNWGEAGNLCEHIIKVIKVCRDTGSSSTQSTSLQQYHQILIDLLHCPHHDSLIRDHAVSLAIFVQMQLDSLIKPDSTRLGVNSIELLDAGSDGNFVFNGEPYRNGNGYVAEQESLRENVAELGQTACENGICGESNQAGLGVSDMEVDPSSMDMEPELSKSLVSNTPSFEQSSVNARFTQVTMKPCNGDLRMTETSDFTPSANNVCSEKFMDNHGTSMNPCTVELRLAEISALPQLVNKASSEQTMDNLQRKEASMTPCSHESNTAAISVIPSSSNKACAEQLPDNPSSTETPMKHCTYKACPVQSLNMPPSTEVSSKLNNLCATDIQLSSDEVEDKMEVNKGLVSS